MRCVYESCYNKNRRIMAAGESYTKGTSHVIVATVVATVLVSIAVAVYLFIGEKPPAVNRRNPRRLGASHAH